MALDPRIAELEESLRQWDRMDKRVGGDVGFTRAGACYLCETPAEVAAYEAWLDKARLWQVQSRILSPDEVTGQRAAILHGQAAALTSEQPSSQSEWVSGMLEFNNTPLSDVLAEVNRYSKRHILLADPKLAVLRVTGAFKANVPAEVAENLAALFQLRVQSNPQGNWVLSR